MVNPRKRSHKVVEQDRSEPAASQSRKPASKRRETKGVSLFIVRLVYFVYIMPQSDMLRWRWKGTCGCCLP